MNDPCPTLIFDGGRPVTTVSRFVITTPSARVKRWEIHGTRKDAGGAVVIIAYAKTMAGARKRVRNCGLYPMTWEAPK